MYIYLISCDAFREKSLGKIGSTENPLSRICGINTMLPPNQKPSFDIVYDGIWKTNATTRDELYIQEIEAHRHFATYRLRRSIKDDTEWFDFNGKVPYDVVSEYMKTMPWMIKEVKIEELYPNKGAPGSVHRTFHHTRRQYQEMGTTHRPISWNDIIRIEEDQANDIYNKIKMGQATHEMIWSHKQFIFREALKHRLEQEDSHEAEENMRELWERFYMTQNEECFWNIYLEKHLTEEELVLLENKKSERARRYYIMNHQDKIPQRQRAIKEFLGILGMKHSQEHVIFSDQRLEEITLVLGQHIRRLLNELNMRQCRYKNDIWGKSNTIDMIRSVMRQWACNKIDISLCRIRVTDKKYRKRVYIIEINKENTLWDRI